jgi:hypothetical protein
MRKRPTAILCLLLCILFIIKTQAQLAHHEVNQEVLSEMYDSSSHVKDTAPNNGNASLIRGNSIKIKALFPHGNLMLGVEFGLKNHNSIEIETGFINIAGDIDYNLVGYEQKIGYKFMLHRIFSHPVEGTSNLHGFYIKPEMAGGVLIQRKSYTDKNEVYGTASFFVLAGYQWVLGKIFVIDLYAGPGIPTIFHPNFEHDNAAKVLGHYTLGKDFPFALAAGLKLGIHF